MADMCFFPGLAAARLECLAEIDKKPKSKILRGLIEAAPLTSIKGLRNLYNGLTSRGKNIVDLAHEGRIDDIIKVMSSVINAVKKYETEYKKGNEPVEKTLLTVPEKLSKPGKAHMTFRPNEQEEKLKNLAERSGTSKAATLRALIMGIALPDYFEYRAYARLAQLGGLAKHIAYQMQDHKEWRKLEALGFDAIDRARPQIRKQYERRKNAGSLYDKNDSKGN